MLTPKVLIVDDDPLTLKAMKMQFENSGFTVKTTQDGDDTLKLLKSWIPSAIILDILMPKKDGYQVLGAIKSDPKLKGIPVIIASNLSQEKDITRGMDLSAAEFIVKSDMSLADLVGQTLYYIKMSAHGQKTLAN